MLKMALYIGIGVLVLFEAASPWITKFQVDSTAATAVQETLLQLERAPGNHESARAVADKEAAEGSATVKEFEIDPDGRVHLTLYRRAKSFVVERWDKASGYYDVEVSTDARLERGGKR